MFTSPRNTIFILALCCVFFLLGYSFQFLQYGAQPETQSFINNTLDQQQKIHSLKTENDALLKENKLLNLTISSINNTTNRTQIEAFNKNTDAPVTSQASSNQHIQELKAEIYKQKSETLSRWLNDSIKNSPHFDLNNEMHQRFESEPLDNTWASQEESKITNYFSDIPEFSGIALRETKCRSTQCQILISTTDVTQANDIVNTISNVFREKNNSSMVIATPDPQNNLTTIYIARDEKSFNFY